MTPKTDAHLAGFLAQRVMGFSLVKQGGVDCWEGEQGIIRAKRWTPTQRPGHAWGVVLAMLARGDRLVLDPLPAGTQARFGNGAWREHPNPLAALCLAAVAAVAGHEPLPEAQEPSQSPGGPGWWWYLWLDGGDWKSHPVNVQEGADGGLYLEGRKERVRAADLPGLWWGPLPQPPLPARPTPAPGSTARETTS